MGEKKIVERITQYLKIVDHTGGFEKVVDLVIKQKKITPRFLVTRFQKPELVQEGFYKNDWYKNAMENILAFSHMICESEDPQLKKHEDVPISKLIGPRIYIFEECVWTDHIMKGFTFHNRFVLGVLDYEKRLLKEKNFIEKCACGCGRYEWSIGPFDESALQFSDKKGFLRIKHYVSLENLIKPDIVILNKKYDCIYRYFFEEGVINARIGKEILNGRLKARRKTEWRLDEIMDFLNSPFVLEDGKEGFEGEEKLIELMYKKMGELKEGEKNGG